MGIVIGSAKSLLALGIIAWCFFSARETKASEAWKHRRAFDGGCTSSRCHANAVCTELSGTRHSCVCERGFYGNGTDCTDAGIWGVKVVLDVEANQCGEEGDVDKMVNIFSSLLINNDVAKTPESEVAAATAEVALTSYDLSTDAYQVSVSVLFADQAAADAAQSAYAAASLDTVLAQEGSTATGEVVTVGTSPLSEAFSAASDIRPMAGVARNGEEISLVGTSFKAECAGSGKGCWVLNVKLPDNPRENTYYALYIPRAEGTNILPTGGTYTDTELATFDSANFPCRSSDIDPLQSDGPHTACCVDEFVSNYRTVEGFSEFIQSNAALDSCGAGCAPASSTVCSAPEGTTTDHRVLLGTFSGLNFSYVERQSDNSVRMYLDEEEFRNYAAQITETDETIYYLTTFIGLAQFDCSAGLLESHAFQLSIDAEKSDLFAIATHGSELNGFLEYVNVRASEIDTWSQPVPDAVAGEGEGGEASGDVPDVTLQWATISFTIASDFTFDAPTLDMTKIRVGKGVFIDDAEWIQACELIWENPSDQADYTRLFNQWCAPDVSFCRTPTSFPEGFVTLHVPLGEGFFTTGEDGDDSSLFVQMEVAALDQFGRPVVNVLSASVPLGSSRNRYCEYAGGDAELLEVANADLWVGSVGTQAELDANLIRRFDNIGTDITSPMAPSAIDSKSIESGLMTLILHGDDDYFNLEVSGGYSLELEDVYTIHIMESGEDMYNQVYDLVRGGKAWRIVIDAETRQAHLQHTAELQTFCGFSPPSATFFDPLPVTCVSRRDVQTRQPLATNGGDKTVLELVNGTEGEAAAAAYFQVLLGNNDFAAELGRNFSRLVLANNDINGRYKRAFWINPGYEWAPSLTNGASVFELSSRVILGALINLNEEGRANRRMLLQSGGNGYFEGIASANLVYAVDPSSLLANILDLSQELVTTWNIGMQLTEEQACMAPQDLRDEMVHIFIDYLAETASPIDQDKIQIYKVQLDRADVTCSGAARRGPAKPQLRPARRVAYSKARGNFETVIGFLPGDRVYLDTKRFSEMPGVLSLSSSTVPDGFVFSPTDPSAENPLATPEPSGPAWKLIGVVCGSVGGLMLLVLLGMLWMRKRHEDDKEERRAEVVWHRSMRHLEMIKHEIKREIMVERSSMATGEEDSSSSSSASHDDDGSSSSSSRSGSGSSRSRSEDGSGSESEGGSVVDSPRGVVPVVAAYDDDKRSGRGVGGLMDDARSHRSGRSQQSQHSRVSHHSTARSHDGTRSQDARSQRSMDARSQKSQEGLKSEEDTVEDASRFWLF